MIFAEDGCGVHPKKVLGGAYYDFFDFFFSEPRDEAHRFCRENSAASLDGNMEVATS